VIYLRDVSKLKRAIIPWLNITMKECNSINELTSYLLCHHPKGMQHSINELTSYLLGRHPEGVRLNNK
jgi:hypothetical protein